MQEIVLNQEFLLLFPEGFTVLSEEEREKLNFLREGEGICLSDPERHIMASLAWQAAGFAALLLSPKDLAGNAEKYVRKAMENANYRKLAVEDLALAGDKGAAYTYLYEANDTKMYGKSAVLKKGSTIYYLHFYAHEGDGESRGLIDQILASLAPYQKG